MTGEVRIARGVRAAEAVVLEAIAEHAEALRGDPARLAQPLTVVVPSKSLRAHLGAAAVHHVGHSLAGVVIRTLHGFAQDILDRAGESFPDGEALVPVLTRRLARGEKRLHASLDGLEDGYGAVAESVSDLIDAGLDAASAEAAEEALGEAPGGAVSERAQAVVRVAAGVLAELDALGYAPRAALFLRARDRLRADPGAVLPGPVWVHGYADATGVQADLLEALFLSAGAQVVLDRPPDPAHPDREDLGVRFGERLAARFGLGGTGVPGHAGEPRSVVPARPRLVAAAGAQGEARAVAEAIRRRLDAGARAEGIGIVARQLEPYLAPLRIQLRRLGVPHSGAPGARGPLGPEGRRLRPLLELLTRGEQTATDRWLDARENLSPRRRSELRLAFHTLGAARLHQLPELDLDARLGGGPGSDEPLRLPVRRGLRTVEGRERRESHRVPRRDLDKAVGRATRLVAHLESWRGVLALAEHRTRLVGLLDQLGWRPMEREGEGGVREAAEGVGSGLPEDLELDFEEFRLLVEDVLEGRGSLPPGGAGGGVALLSVTDARARSFEELFVLGMNRDRFPRVVTEDALLPDAARRSIEPVLPDVPLKLRGYDEERFLFAQLVSASPLVTLLWQSVDDDGRERNASPAIERMRFSPGAPVVEAASGPLAANACSPATAAEQAMRAGLAGVRRLEPLVAEALGEARRELGLDTSDAGQEALAAARLAVLREFERPPRADLGPYFGFVGPRDPEELLYVTFYESVAFCPWKSFLGRRLGLEAVPDARAELPEATPRLRGTLVHAVLEQVAVRAGVPRETPFAALAEPHRVPWPDAPSLEALLAESAERITREEGIGLPNFSRLLAASVRPLVAQIEAADWAGGPRDGVLGVESLGVVELSGPDGPYSVGFKADRVDALATARVLTDYKAASPPSTAAKPETRWRVFLQQILHGRRLQGNVYAEAGGLGRYLFADPGKAAEAVARECPVAADDAEAGAAFGSAMAVLRRAWTEGALPPRLLSEDRRSVYRFCQDCEVSEACLQGDSGAGRRLRAWLEEPPAGEGAAERAARALVGLAATRLDDIRPPAEDRPSETQKGGAS